MPYTLTIEVPEEEYEVLRKEAVRLNTIDRYEYRPMVGTLIKDAITCQVEKIKARNYWGQME